MSCHSIQKQMMAFFFFAITNEECKEKISEKTENFLV